MFSLQRAGLGLGTWAGYRTVSWSIHSVCSKPPPGRSPPDGFSPLDPLCKFPWPILGWWDTTSNFYYFWCSPANLPMQSPGEPLPMTPLRQRRTVAYDPCQDKENRRTVPQEGIHVPPTTTGTPHSAPFLIPPRVSYVPVSTRSLRLLIIQGYWFLTEGVITEAGVESQLVCNVLMIIIYHLQHSEDGCYLDYYFTHNILKLIFICIIISFMMFWRWFLFRLLTCSWHCWGNFYLGYYLLCNAFEDNCNQNYYLIHDVFKAIFIWVMISWAMFWR